MQHQLAVLVMQTLIPWMSRAEAEQRSRADVQSQQLSDRDLLAVAEHGENLDLCQAVRWLFVFQISGNIMLDD
jgi:hypothetical protein